ncbi:MAG: SpoVG family protein [Mycoplasmatales bacterium]
MEVTNITMRVVEKDGLKAICSLNFNNLLVVHNIRLIEGKEGMFLSFPARVKGDGNFLDIVHPIDSNFRNELTTMIINKYNEEKTNI